MPGSSVTLAANHVKPCHAKTAWVWAAAFAALVIPHLGPGGSLRAATLAVTTPADSGPGSLRDQVAASSPGDTIVFAISGVIPLNSAIPIGNSISIFGPGPSLLAVSGQNVDRVFVITASSVFLSGMTVRDGRIVAPSGTDGGLGQNGMAGFDAQAGAIYDSGGALTLSNCWFAANQAVAGNGGRGGDNPVGAVFTPGQGGAGGQASGGAVYGAGSVTAIRCTFSSNRVVGGNGGNGGDNLNAAVGEAGGQGGGGGVGACGAVLASDGPYFTLCTFSGNLAAGGNGGNGGDTSAVFIGGTGGDGNSGECGGFHVSANAQVISCTVVSNTAYGGQSGAGGAGTPAGPSGNAGAGSFGGICGYAIACKPQLGNTIVAQNVANVFSNTYAYFEDLGYNFLGDDYYPGPCMGPTTRMGTVASPLDPLLEPLAQNGSGLPTHKPAPFSPVLDAGASFSLTTDERGAPRPYDLPNYPNASDGSDIGAFEASQTELALSVVSNNVVVSWPAWAGDAILQCNTNLALDSHWTTDSNQPAVLGDRFYVTSPVGATPRFYRLVDR
ncbi:MAG TPA: choice-of-anchor Q domain-containing protein [Candidatus Acidoferrum sp.]|nr:choice-of-anchor Q domain-containing protein [Candidatus Acidoferrum sp.]